MAAGHPRLSFSLLAGTILFLLLPGAWHASLRSILAWDAGAGLFLLLSLIAFAHEPLAQMERDAESQREGEWTIFAVTLIGVSMSFIVITQEFASLKAPGSSFAPLRVALVAITLLASWLVTHFCFAFRYAHEYYERDQDVIQGGLDFPGNQAPDYWDFLYFSLVLGMTFQVSDVEITSRKLRRLATLHGFLGFLFNTVLLAFAVNLAAGLL
jgi:uncharacterized membrane protein